MFIINLKKSTKYLLLIFLLLFFILTPLSVSAIASSSVKPSVVTLGDISNHPSISFEVTVNNNDEVSTFKGISEGKGSENITFSPNTFELGKGESKKVKITVNNTDTLKIGPYDLTIKFLSAPASKGWVSAKATSSLRLTFKISGISIASLNVKDIEASIVNTFYVVYGNYTDKDQSLDSTITIINKETNKKVYEIKDSLTMKPYPKDFYGTMKMSLPMNGLEMGDYILKLKGVTPDGKTLIEEEKLFKVGVIKGELIGVAAEDVYVGDTAQFIAEVKNLGNLPLQTTFNGIVKNSSGQKVFEDTKTIDIKEGISEKLTLEWITKKVPAGEYTLDYTVKMGDEIVSGSKTFKVRISYIYYILAAVFTMCILILIFIILRKRENN